MMIQGIFCSVAVVFTKRAVDLEKKQKPLLSQALTLVFLELKSVVPTQRGWGKLDGIPLMQSLCVHCPCPTYGVAAILW